MVLEEKPRLRAGPTAHFFLGSTTGFSECLNGFFGSLLAKGFGANRYLEHEVPLSFTSTQW